MDFRILGPLEVWHEGGEVAVGGPKPRALLAVLLLHANEVVPADRLIDELWGDDSPGRAADALRVNVSRLRKALPEDVLATASPGYAIRVKPDALDLNRFERLVDEGRDLLARGLAADASDRLRDALQLWRGPALADFRYESFAQASIGRLEEIRLAALELRIEADLRRGRHDEVVGELEELVAEHPLRERLQMWLMTALYRSGRQAEALGAYKEARRALVDGVGIEPSRALQDLERAILQQSPALDADPSHFPAREHSERSILAAITNSARIDALLAVAEPLARHPPHAIVLARLVADAGELGSTAAWLDERRSTLAGAASWPARLRSPRRLRGRSSPDCPPSSTWSFSSPTLRMRSLRRECLTSSSPPFSRRPHATSRSSSRGRRHLRARWSSPSEAPITTGRPSSSARGLHMPSERRSGSLGRQRSRSSGSATRAACFRMEHSRSSVCWASRLSRS